MALGEVTNPSGTEKLHEYWVHGEGAAKIAWGAPGSTSVTPRATARKPITTRWGYGRRSMPRR